MLCSNLKCTALEDLGVEDSAANLASI